MVVRFSNYHRGMNAETKVMFYRNTLISICLNCKFLNKRHGAVLTLSIILSEKVHFDIVIQRIANCVIINAMLF